MKERGEMDMSMFANVKPIQATPELKGQDAVNFIKQACSMPQEEEVNKNKNLLKILKRIQK